MSANHSLHHRLRRLKAALLAVSFTLAGILLMMLNAWLTPLQLGDWVDAYDVYGGLGLLVDQNKYQNKLSQMGLR